jgi:hypothetical protein
VIIIKFRYWKKEKAADHPWPTVKGGNLLPVVHPADFLSTLFGTA